MSVFKQAFPTIPMPTLVLSNFCRYNECEE